MAVTEPDFGSDVAGIVTSATPADGGWVINGVKTWCTFAARADVLMLLARTDPDRSEAHRGLSMFVVEKPRGDGHGFVFTQDARPAPGELTPGRLEGRPIDTIGYRGMHSYELAFENWFVPDANLVGGEAGLWARASTSRCRASRTAGSRRRRGPSGVMQAAYEAAVAYAAERKVFGSPIGDYQLTRAKLGRMAVHHPGHPAVLVPRGPADGPGRGHARGLDGEGLRVPGRRMGRPARPCRSTAAWATPRSSRSAATSSTPGCSRSSRGPTRRLALKVIARRLIG